LDPKGPILVRLLVSMQLTYPKFLHVSIDVDYI